MARLEAVIVGSSAHNAHVQNMARALYDVGALHTYATGGVDVFHGPLLRRIRSAAGAVIPGLDGAMARRAVPDLPGRFVAARWRWEGPRAAACRLGLDERLVDWLWERGELDLDRACAGLVARRDVGGFLGVEFGALAALRAARRLDKPAIVAFLSPHHRTLAKWLDAKRHDGPEPVGPRQPYFEARAAVRDARRDEEAAVADRIVTNSAFTTKSLVDAGVETSKIVTVPLGGPDPVPASALPARRPDVVRFMYAGPVSIRKGAHYLLRAWRRVARRGIELHCYGAMLLPEAVQRELGVNARQSAPVVLHGPVTTRELDAAYLGSSVLVLPTLCDGFGLVVSEALAHGLPVVTTTNAGAADLIQHGRTGFVIAPADLQDLESTLSWCADHPAELFAMRRHALEAAARWTWADFRRAFVDRLARSYLTEPGASSLESRPAAVSG